MKVTYRFANGEISEVEVSEEIGEVIMSSRRKEHADDEKQRYHASYSLNDVKYEGLDLADEETPERMLIDDFDKQRIWDAFDQLNEKQKRRLWLQSEGFTVRQIAAMEGTAVSTIQESIDSAKKKFKKVF